MAAAAVKPVAANLRAPQKGNPPSLEWIGVDRLSVDPAYQRATDSPASRKIIVGMVKGWDWALCQPLVVSRRAGGGLFILDGQHRHAGAVERGDIPHLPCVVLGGVALAEEAGTFVALNQQRQRLSQADIFHAMLAAGDADAQLVQDLLEETGWRLVRSRNTAARKPGELDCAPMIVIQLRYEGRAAIHQGLTSLRAAYPDAAVRQVATMLKALFYLYSTLFEEGDSAAALHAAIGAHDPDTWIMRAAVQRERQPTLSNHAALARVMIDAARGKPLTPPVAPPVAQPQAPQPRHALRPAAPPEAGAFTGPAPAKAFCRQCDRLRTLAEAHACRDAHCKLKSAPAA